MLSKSTFSQLAIYLGILTTGIFTVNIAPASSQLLPQAWVTLGGNEGDFTYGAGARLLNFGLEVGTGKEGATGGDILTFLPLPIVSPYVGLGIYSGDDTVAYSGGVHFGTGNLILGGGYHSIRGFNGKIGFRF